VLAPNTVFTEPAAEQRAVPWDRIEPEQSEHHDHIDDVPAERELVESEFLDITRVEFVRDRRARSSDATRLAAW
jgi:hypothetical protein